MQAVGDRWKLMEYEVKMFDATYKIFFTRSRFFGLPFALKNAVEESAVLHTRILCEIFLGRTRRKDDIRLADLLPGWPNDPKYTKLKAINDKLNTVYGESCDQGSPCWDFNKRVAHPTLHRGKEYDYRKILYDLHPLIREIIAEFESLTGKRFRRQFDGPTSQPTLFWA